MNTNLAHEPVDIEATLLELLTMHGLLCLALRHPALPPESRAIGLAWVERIGSIMTGCGFITADEWALIKRTEQQAQGDTSPPPPPGRLH